MKSLSNEGICLCDCLVLSQLVWTRLPSKITIVIDLESLRTCNKYQSVSVEEAVAIQVGIIASVNHKELCDVLIVD